MPTGFFEFRQRVTQNNRMAAPQQPLTVSELTILIDGALKRNLPPSVSVRGEVSNLRRQDAGHLYFTLKDKQACIECVMFSRAAAALRFRPDDGMELIATGRITVYAPRGRYQLNAATLQPIGQGALELAYRQLCAKLEAEGLFDPARKRPLPPYPLRIGLVTSAATAAFQDMLKVLRRFPFLRLCLYPVPVQGEGAAAQIAAALEHLGRSHGQIGGVDAVLLARGGGSLEDLWPFNEEIVARAVVACPVPVVTGIGHETDTSIADLAADFHAHTPTAAAEAVTARWRTAGNDVDMHRTRLRRALRQLLEGSRHRLAGIERHEAFRRPLDRLDRLRQQVDDDQRALRLAMATRLRSLHRSVADLSGRMERCAPAVLLLRARERLRRAEKALGLSIAARLREMQARLARQAALLAERHPRNRISLERQRLAGLETCLRTLDPQNVLRRGYSITVLKKGGAIVRTPAQVRPGDRLLTRLADGQIESTAEDTNQRGLFDELPDS